MNKMIETIKEIHTKDICLFKIGTFYHAYGRDAYILSYMFGYKIKDLEKKYKECGFPVSAISKVCAKLENNKINYLIIDRRNNYDVDEKEDYKNLNRYAEFYEKANKYVKTPHFRAEFSVLHLSSTHSGTPDWIRTSGL